MQSTYHSVDLRALFRVRRADLYDAWLFAEVEAALALEAWRSAPCDAKAGAYDVYVAALDREEQAAGMLELRVT